MEANTVFKWLMLVLAVVLAIAIFTGLLYDNDRHIRHLEIDISAMEIEYPNRECPEECSSLKMQQFM